MIYRYNALLTARKENSTGVPSTVQISYLSQHYSIDVLDEILQKEAIQNARMLGYETYVVHSVSLVKDAYLPSSVVAH